jgi:thiol-disulfide isomerase/thioredoxin/DNA-directed RNA polymerase subunit RPC12/RpoP
MLATKFHCPSCGALLKTAHPPAAGKGVKCPRCGSLFTPAPEPQRRGHGDTPGGEEPATGTFEHGPEPGKARSGVRKGKPHGPPVEVEEPQVPTMEFTGEEDAGPAERAGRGPVAVRKKKRRAEAVPSRLPILLAVGGLVLVLGGGAVLGTAWAGVWPFKKREAAPRVERDDRPAPKPAPRQEPKPPPEEKTPPAEQEAPDVPDPAVKPRRPVSADGTPWVGLGVGNRALEIEGEDLDGKPLKLSDYRGYVVVLDFWGDWCPFCRDMYPYEKALVARMAGKPFVLLGVNSDARKETARKVAEKHQLGMRSWWDGKPTGQPINSQWNIQSVPNLFVIDHKGVIRMYLRGKPRDPKALDDFLDKLVAEAQAAASAGKR